MALYTTLINAHTLRDNISNPRWIVFDCRFNLAAIEQGENDYLQSHIPGAHYVHLDNHLSSPITATSGRHPLPAFDHWCESLAQWGLGDKHQAVVYDDSFGSIAARMWWMLRWAGFSNVALLDGGLQAWRANHFPTDSQLPIATYSKFNCSEQQTSVVSSRDVLNALAHTPDRIILDVRAAERFRGEVEPIDPVAGHIPASINIPYTHNLTPSGTFKTQQELRDMYSQNLSAAHNIGLAVMCGSGVTACHSLIALQHAGFTDAKLYAGSWSEWIRDPNRPVETSL